MNEVNIDAATAAHEAYDADPSRANFEAVMAAAALLTPEEWQAYMVNYTNRVVRKRSEEASGQSA